jgi:hypothetical protein
MNADDTHKIILAPSSAFSHVAVIRVENIFESERFMQLHKHTSNARQKPKSISPLSVLQLYIQCQLNTD